MSQIQKVEAAKPLEYKDSWACTLSCGHKVNLFSKKNPVGTSVNCHDCSPLKVRLKRRSGFVMPSR